MTDKQKLPRIHLYTGSGECKTTNALGLALRAVGHGKKVIVIQFMKGRKDIGEYKIRKRLYPEYEIHQFGRKEFVNLKNPKKIDYVLAQKGLNFAKKALKKRPDLLILEEINLAVAIGLLKLNDVIGFLKSIPKGTVVVLTGRRAHKKLIEISDLVTVMQDIKHPFRKGIIARKGIEY